MVWSTPETRLFVKLYLGHTCLWNTEDVDYKLKFKRQEAYCDVAKKFQALTNIQMNEYEVRTKIKSLRSTYCQEIQKIKRKSTTGTPYKSSLKWFDDFHKCFSREFIPRRLYEKRSSCEPDEQQEPETETEDASKIWVQDDCELGGENNEEDTINPPFVSTTDDDYILLLKNEPDQEETEQRPFKTRKRKIKRRFSSTDQSVEGPSTKEDEFDIYAKYIASQLRRMDIQRALRVQLQIQNIVSEARIDDLSGDDEDQQGNGNPTSVERQIVEIDVHVPASPANAIDEESPFSHLEQPAGEDAPLSGEAD